MQHCSIAFVRAPGHRGRPHSNYSAHFRVPAIRVRTSSGRCLVVLSSSPHHATTTRRLNVGVLDLVAKSPKNSVYGRVMNPNLASIMPQVIGVWCEEAGHRVHYVCYTGRENLLDGAAAPISTCCSSASFTEAAHLAYAISNLFRQRGAITILGGPHARCYPKTRSGSSTTCSASPTGRWSTRSCASAAGTDRWAARLPRASSRPSCRASRRAGSSSPPRWPRRPRSRSCR